jgi:hypothetical protein
MQCYERKGSGIFFILKFWETITESNYAEALCVFRLIRGDLGFCPKQERLCRIGQ